MISQVLLLSFLCYSIFLLTSVRLFFFIVVFHNPNPKFVDNKIIVTVCGRTFEFHDSFSKHNEYVSKNSGFQRFEYADLVREDKE